MPKKGLLGLDDPYDLGPRLVEDPVPACRAADPRQTAKVAALDDLPAFFA